MSPSHTRNPTPLPSPGDAYFHPGELDAARPHCPPGLALFESMVQTDKPARLANQRRLRALSQQHGGEVRVISALSAAEFQQCTRLPHAAAGSGRGSGV